MSMFKKYKQNTQLVFANITKPLNADVKMISGIYENIIKKRGKTSKNIRRRYN